MISRFPLSSLPLGDVKDHHYGTLVLSDGTAYHGISFGAEKNVAGECVFQTGLFVLLSERGHHVKNRYGGLSGITDGSFVL